MNKFQKALYWTGTAICFSVLMLIGVAQITAQETADVSPEESETELLTVNDDATKEELQEQSKKINEHRPEKFSLEYYKSRMKAIYKINDLLLQKDDLTDDEKKFALSQKVSAMLTLAQLADNEELLALEEAFLTDPLIKEADKMQFLHGKSLFISLRLMKLKKSEDDTDPVETEKLIQEMLANFNEDEDFAPFLISNFGLYLEMCNNSLYFKYLDDVEKALTVKNAEKYGKLIESIQGHKRRASLEGNEMRIEGIKLDGSPIDWESYKGKVVLVDFWATWCGPCMAEVPNMKEQYEKYHNQGFEIIGYSVDADLDALKKTVENEKLPWTIMSSVMTEEKNNELTDDQKFAILSRYYAVSAIPFMVLIDRDGKVISSKARGENLNHHLEILFSESK